MDHVDVLGRKAVRLLVIMDDLSSQQQLEEQVSLIEHQYSITYKYAKSSAEVSELMREWGPSVVLVDAFCRSVNCFEFVEQWREGVSSIVVTSEAPSQSIAESAMLQGASAYIVRGEDLEDVEFLLEQIVALAPQVESLH